MPLGEHLSLAEVKNRLSEGVDKLEREHGRVVVTKNGRPAAVMLNVDDPVVAIDHRGDIYRPR